MCLSVFINYTEKYINILLTMRAFKLQELRLKKGKLSAQHIESDLLYIICSAVYYMCNDTPGQISSSKLTSNRIVCSVLMGDAPSKFFLILPREGEAIH